MTPELLYMILLLTLTIAQNENGPYILNTRACKIPKFNVTFQDGPPGLTCRSRKIFVKKISGSKIKFFIMERFGSCCFSYIYRSSTPSEEDHKVKLSPCTYFNNNTEIQFKSELISIKCLNPNYEDYYAFVKEIKGNIKNRPSNSWNLLMVGIDTMSRARAYNSLSKTTNYFRNNQWLDFRVYNKIASNTKPNVVAALCGRNKNWLLRGDVCVDRSRCNHLLIWQKFKRAGYVTAFGEDGTYLGGTFQTWSLGFSKPPTDHYLRPLFLAGEESSQPLVCTGRISSGKHIVNYMLDYIQTYEKKNVFALSWFNSFSHDPGQSPKLFDDQLQDFFKKLQSRGVMENTIVIAFSDHGINFGPVRYSIESYYEERLPMLFIWIPRNFRKMYPSQYANLITNQRRLISPYDLYLTLLDILKLNNGTKSQSRAQGCSSCVSLFKEVPKDRSCSDAGIPDQFCTCYSLHRAIVRADLVNVSTLAIRHLQSLPKTLPTSRCMSCNDINLKKVLRVHAYMVKDNTTYVVGLLIVPGDVIYEIQVRKYIKHRNETYDILSTRRLTRYSGREVCVKKEIPYHYTCDCKLDLQCVLRLVEKVDPKAISHLFPPTCKP